MSLLRGQEIVRRVTEDATASVGLADETYRRFSPYVAAVALRLDGRSEDLEDLVQDVFLEAARGIKWLRNPDAIKAWLATVTVRLVRRRLRRRRLRRILGLDREFDYQEVASRSASPADRALLAAVYRFLDELPVDERVAWSLHHVEGETLEVIGEMCGCSPATAKRRIARARARIEEVFGDE